MYSKYKSKKSSSEGHVYQLNLTFSPHLNLLLRLFSLVSSVMSFTFLHFLLVLVSLCLTHRLRLTHWWIHEGLVFYMYYCPILLG